MTDMMIDMTTDMASKPITIWVYDDEGASALSVQSALATMPQRLPNSLIITVQTLSSQDIINNVLNDQLNHQSKGILVMPGGADLPYCQQLNGVGNENIRQFISSGNIYIGICAGGYYGARDIEFTGQSYRNGSKKSYEINGARELALFSGTAIGSIEEFTDGQLYDETVKSKAMVTLDYANGQQDEVYYHGGAYFTADEDADFKVIATYSDGKNAVVSGNFGQGQYLLSGVHFELCPNVYEQYAVAQADNADIEKERALLLVINNENYGALIYQEIERMMGAVYKSE